MPRVIVAPRPLAYTAGVPKAGPMLASTGDQWQSVGRPSTGLSPAVLARAPPAPRYVDSLSRIAAACA